MNIQKQTEAANKEAEYALDGYRLSKKDVLQIL